MDRCPDAHHNVNINYYLYQVFIMMYAAPALCYGTYCTPYCPGYFLPPYPHPSHTPTSLHLPIRNDANHGGSKQQIIKKSLAKKVRKPLSKSLRKGSKLAAANQQKMAKVPALATTPALVQGITI